MRVVVTPRFAKAVKRLHGNQKTDLDAAIKALVQNPALGEQKTGDLAWARVFKFRMVNQSVLLAYECSGDSTLVLHGLGSHENFYRDLKRE